MPPKKKQIRILGAGISGLVSGIILAKNGYQVEIFEKRARIGSFFEKDIHSLRNYSYNCDVIEKYKKLGIQISKVHTIFKEIRCVAPSKCIEIFSKNKPLFYNVIRGYNDKYSLDVKLFEQAKKLGVRIYFNQTINPDKKNINIIATGAPNRNKKGIAYGRYYKTVSIIEPNTLYFFLNNDNASSYGYTYLLPFSNNQIFLCLVATPEDKSRLKKRFDTLLEKNNIIKKILKNAQQQNEVFGFGFFDTPKTAIKNKKLYVGEAAGFLDASTGFGLHYAILSGYLATQSIIKNNDYDELWEKTFGKELETKYARRLYLEKLGIIGQKKIIENLIKNYGKKISINNYKKYTENIIKN